MDSIGRYREVIRDLIQEYAKYRPANGDVQIEVIFDESNDHYELVYAGWDGPYRIHGSVCSTSTSVQARSGFSTMAPKTESQRAS